MNQDALRDMAIYNALITGVEFEFYSDLLPKETAKALQAIVGRKVIVCDKYHTELEDKTVWKLEPDASGGKKMMELISPPIPWLENKILLIKIFRWINENGWTTEKSAIHVNMSFNGFKLKLNNKMSNINKLKFILNMDEDFIYSRFPNRKNSIYARSINFIYPINKFTFTSDIRNLDSKSFLLPREKYFGVNFGKIDKEYFEVRYLGGLNYQKKSSEIIEIVEYLAKLTYKTLDEGTNWSRQELGKLTTILDNNKAQISSFSTYENFIVNYPNFNLLIDLKGDAQIIKTHWHAIREKLFELIILSKINKGTLNYDSDLSKFQLKGCIIKEGFLLKDFEFVNCEIIGNLERCDLYFCKVEKSHVINCNLIKSNQVNDSKIIETNLDNINIVRDSYIDNKNHIINCSVEGGIIRSGVQGQYANISEETEIIEIVRPSNYKAPTNDKKNKK